MTDCKQLPLHDVGLLDNPVTPQLYHKYVFQSDTLQQRKTHSMKVLAAV